MCKTKIASPSDVFHSFKLKQTYWNMLVHLAQVLHLPYVCEIIQEDATIVYSPLGPEWNVPTKSHLIIHSCQQHPHLIIRWCFKWDNSAFSLERCQYHLLFQKQKVFSVLKIRKSSLAFKANKISAGGLFWYSFGGNLHSAHKPDVSWNLLHDSPRSHSRN